MGILSLPKLTTRRPKFINRPHRRTNHSTRSLFTASHSHMLKRATNIIAIGIMATALNNQAPNMGPKITKPKANPSKSITTLMTAT